MTKSGRVEKDFALFKQEVLNRLDAIEAKLNTPKSETKHPKIVRKDQITLEAKDDDIVAN